MGDRKFLLDKQFSFWLLLRGEGVSELMDGQGCAILALELAPKDLFYKILYLPFQQGKLERATSFVSHECF